MSEDEEISRDLKQGKKKTRNISIALPMLAWIVLLVVGLILLGILNLTRILTPSTLPYTVFNSLAQFILMLPGSIIFPIIVGAVIGAEVGRHTPDIRSALRSGALNGLYASVIYLVAIFVIYFIMFYLIPSQIPDTNFLIRYWIAVPIVALIVLSALFASFSHLRKL
jgi:hypothetical protein